MQQLEDQVRSICSTASEGGHVSSGADIAAVEAVPSDEKCNEHCEEGEECEEEGGEEGK